MSFEVLLFYVVIRPITYRRSWRRALMALVIAIFMLLFFFVFDAYTALYGMALALACKCHIRSAYSFSYLHYSDASTNVV